MNVEPFPLSCTRSPLLSRSRRDLPHTGLLPKAKAVTPLSQGTKRLAPAPHSPPSPCRAVLQSLCLRVVHRTCSPRTGRFLSTGSSGLSQYLMAADRDSPRVAHVCEPFAPGGAVTAQRARRR
jgi:hypothetical protein